MATKREIRRFIDREIPAYLDDCGEVNCTRAAESACDHFDGYVDHVLYEIPEVFFDTACEAAWAYEKRNAR